MPIAISLVGILVAMSIVSVCQSYLLVQADKLQSYSSYAQVEADNAVEKVRRSFAQQIANHVEVSDVKNPDMWQELRQVCEKGTQCQIAVANIAGLVPEKYLITPSPSDKAIPCNTPAPYNESGNAGFNACNLSVGGALDEERRVVQVRTEIHDKNGVVLASVDRQVRFRLFRLAPYAQVVGIKDQLSNSSAKNIPDIGGFSSSQGAQRDTLLRSYAPCRNLPDDAPTPVADRKYYWNSWDGHATAPPIQVKCEPNDSDTSHFRNGTVLDAQRINGWDEATKQ